MYYPIQIPYILNQEFLQNIEYNETVVPELSDFVICFWQMLPRSEEKKQVPNVIVADACIDLIVAFDEKKIGFSGMRNTNFDFMIHLPSRFMGARLMPGAFHQLTKLPATAAMDQFLPLKNVDNNFDSDHLFSLSFDEAKQYFIDYFHNWTNGIAIDECTSLFSSLNSNIPASVSSLSEQLGYSTRQCQRVFNKVFGLSPKVSLSILRFQRCLEILTLGKASPSDVWEAVSYYDQSHFISDFKRNIGVTPFELIERYKC